MRRASSSALETSIWVLRKCHYTNAGQRLAGFYTQVAECSLSKRWGEGSLLLSLTASQQRISYYHRMDIGIQRAQLPSSDGLPNAVLIKQPLGVV